jgi:hypothetical protein
MLRYKSYFSQTKFKVEYISLYRAGVRLVDNKLVVNKSLSRYWPKLAGADVFLAIVRDQRQLDRYGAFCHHTASSSQR